MSQSRSDQGQSMEEILASIRRIIAEGERDLPGFDPKRPDASEGKPAIDTRPPWSRPEPASQPSSVATDVLVLTEMVQDDGSVVSLESEKPPSPPVELAPDTAVAQPAEAPPAAQADVGVPEPAAPAAEAPPSAEDVLRSIAAGLTVEGTAGMGESVQVPTYASELTDVTAAPLASSDEALSISAVPEIPTQQMEIGSVSGEGLKKPELVSEETVAASTAALTQLAQTVGRTREAAPGSSQSVDELVRSAVEPMLKQWLDANLSRIVERMVREAIEKVVRRVE